MISSARCTVISNKGEVLKEPKFDSIKDQVFNIFSSETVQENRFSFCQTDNYDHITVTQQRVLGGMLQPMSIILVSHQHDDAKKNEVISLYNGIKKHIKKNYVISSDKMIYMGPQAYLDWENRHFKTAYLFLQEKRAFYLSQNEFDLFLKWVDSHFVLFDYTTRLYIQGKRVFEFEEYCIADNMSSIIMHTTRINTIRIDSDSKCVYVRRELKGEKRTLVYIDKRIINEQNQEIIKIFDMIINYISKNGSKRDSIGS
jgi:hypothetical protein